MATRCASLISEREQRNGKNRALHVEAMHEILPPMIRTRTSKAFFGDLILPYLQEFQSRWSRVDFEQSHPWIKDHKTAKKLLEQVLSRSRGTSLDWAIWSLNSFAIQAENDARYRSDA